MTIYEIYNNKTGNHVADILYNRDTDQFSSQIFIKKETPIVFAKIIQGKAIWGACENPDSIYLEAWLKDRVIPRNRQMLKEVLERNGIYEYDWRELIRLNKGQTVSDYFRVEVREDE